MFINSHPSQPLFRSCCVYLEHTLDRQAPARLREMGVGWEKGFGVSLRPRAQLSKDITVLARVWFDLQGGVLCEGLRCGGVKPPGTQMPFGVVV